MDLWVFGVVINANHFTQISSHVIEIKVDWWIWVVVSVVICKIDLIWEITVAFVICRVHESVWATHITFLGGIWTISKTSETISLALIGIVKVIITVVTVLIALCFIVMIDVDAFTVTFALANEVLISKTNI